jgi:hypothetical protein
MVVSNEIILAWEDYFRLLLRRNPERVELHTAMLIIQSLWESQAQLKRAQKEIDEYGNLIAVCIKNQKT